MQKIETEEENDNCLKYIEKIMDSSDPDDFILVQILVELVIVYEDIHYPLNDL